jgi:hypothetical protein
MKQWKWSTKIDSMVCIDITLPNRYITTHIYQFVDRFMDSNA